MYPSSVLGAVHHFLLGARGTRWLRLRRGGLGRRRRRLGRRRLGRRRLWRLGGHGRRRLGWHGRRRAVVEALLAAHLHALHLLLAICKWTHKKQRTNTE
jgi:hypothetical protein